FTLCVSVSYTKEFIMLIFVSKMQGFIRSSSGFYLTGGILFNYFSGLLFNYIIHFTLSPATIRVNKELVFQKNWWQTDINRQDAQPQEETKLKVKDVYWKKGEQDTKKYIDYPNYPVTLFIETMDYNEGDTATIILKSKNNRKFAGGKDELSVSGKVDADGIATIENFKINYTL
ncbi:hypothetical protein, partial [Dysgonomonas sp. ZJ279]|uniref:hypothetical protein n=1 Tax=Dysgonomonas sp. ZJ279 TaxID=2709796 RepID=UPI001C889E4E